MQRERQRRLLAFAGDDELLATIQQQAGPGVIEPVRDLDALGSALPPDGHDGLRRRNAFLTSLNSYSMEIAALPFSADLPAVAARHLQEMTGALAVGISLYDRATSELVVRCTTLSSATASLVARLIGRGLTGMRLKVDPEAYRRIVSERIADTGSLAETLLGNIPAPVARLVEQALGIGWFTGISLESEGQLLGTVIIVGRSGETRPEREDLMALAAVTANGLRRWLAEQAAQESQARYQLLTDSMEDAVWQLSLDGVFTYVSPSVHRVLGYTAEEMTGMPLVELLDPEERARMAAILDRMKGAARSGIEPASPIYRVAMRHRDGRRLWVEVRSTRRFDAHGNLIGYQGMTRDVTARHEAEEALRDSEELLRSFVEESLAGLIIIDERGTIVQFNEAAARVSGLARHEVEGQLWWDVAARLIPSERRTEERRAELERMVTEALRTGRPASAGPAQYEIERPDGVRVHVEQTVFPIRSARGVRFGTMVIDVSGRREAEHQRQRLEGQLQQAMKMEAIGRLAGGVAHDFNNVLTGILGHADLLGTDLADDHPAQASLREIRACAESAADLTRRLLAFSRKQVIEPRIVELGGLVAGLRGLLRRLIGEDVRLRIVAGEGVAPVRVDPGQIEQVLVNMAVNARDAMPAGGALIVETADVVLDEEYCRLHPRTRPGRYSRLTVSDTGHGMSAEVRQHLFEPFFTTKPQGQGTGLGLATTYGIVQQAGGTIEVYSEEGHGTTFRIYLPAVEDANVAAPPVARSTEIPTGTETVLLVEDEANVRDLARRILLRLGYTVHAAGSSEEALELMSRIDGGVDLLLTDVVMPGMNGRQLAARLTDRQPGLKVLFTSGYTENVIAHHGVLEQGIHFLPKPYTPLGLARKLREVLQADPARR